MLRLRTLGGLGLETTEGATIPLQGQRKALVLLAILAASGSRGISRERLMTLLWTESDSGHASGALRQMLHSLRKQLRIPQLVTGTSELRLNPECIQSDIGRLNDLLLEGDLSQAVDKYTGPFLDGISLPGVAEFERWQDSHRSALERRVATAIERLAKEAEVNGNLDTAIAWWRRLQALDPCNGQTALDLIRTLEKSGDPGGALQHARSHERAVQQELATSANPAVTEAATRLRQKSNSANVGHRLEGPPTKVAAPTGDAEAYELYLKGRYFWTQRTRTKLEQALGYFQRAVERDPEFALAYVALADTYVNMANFGHMPSSVALAHAGAAADRAIMLDPRLCEAHASRGFVLTAGGKLEDADKAFRTSIDINPSYAPAHHYYTLLLTMTNRVARAEQENAIALRLNPLSLGANAHRGVLRLMRNDFTRARNDFHHALELSPGFALALAFVGNLEAAEGRYDEGLKSLERARRSAPRFPGIIPALTYAYSRVGRTRESAVLVSEMMTHATDDRSRINLAFAHAMKGSLDLSFGILDGVRWDIPTRIFLRASPLLNQLREDQRYAQLG